MLLPASRPSERPRSIRSLLERLCNPAQLAHIWLRDPRNSFAIVLQNLGKAVWELVLKVCGEESAVIPPFEEWRRLRAFRPSLKIVLLAPQARCDDLPLPKRGSGKPRASPDF